MMNILRPFLSKRLSNSLPYLLVSTRFRNFSSQENQLPYNQFLGQFFKEPELQSKESELQTLLSILSLKKMDYKEKYDKGLRQREGKLTDKEEKEMKDEEQVVMDKIKQAEASKIYVDFYNKPALRLISRSKFVRR